MWERITAPPVIVTVLWVLIAGTIVHVNKKDKARPVVVSADANTVSLKDD